MEHMRIFPPWSDKDIAALKRWQQAETVHPFTCIEAHQSELQRILVPTKDGWICPTCSYTQNWAHAFMLHEPPTFNGIGLA
jgi:hypothetical protein